MSLSGYPDYSIRVSCDNDILHVPLIHLRHAAAQDLLTAPCEGVSAGNGAAINAPHVNVGACTGHNIPLRTPKTQKHTYFIRQPLHSFCNSWWMGLTVSSLMHRAETGARCPLSWVTNDNLLRSQMMQVRSREPLTTMRYAEDAVRHVTASVWPSSACDAKKIDQKNRFQSLKKKT